MRTMVGLCCNSRLTLSRSTYAQNVLFSMDVVFASLKLFQVVDKLGTILSLTLMDRHQ